MITKSNGFTLVEMSVVLVIAGLLIATAITVGGTQIAQYRLSGTKQKQEAIKTALTSFVLRNERLPCPAIATIQPGNAGYGTEAANPGTCTGANISGGVATGILPFSSLGITSDSASDGYYNRYTYSVTLNATNPPSVSGMLGNISVHTDTPIVLGAAGNQSNDCNTAGYNPCAAVAAIISHGANGLGAYTTEGTQLPAPVNDELENADGGSAIVVKDYSTGGGDPFDDVVMPITAAELLTPLTTQGSIKDYKSQLNDSFRDITAAVIANAIASKNLNPVYIATCTYPLPSSLPALPPETIYDPWGNGISYTRLELTITSATPPGNVAFRLGYTEYGIALTKDVFVNQLQDAFERSVLC